MPTIARRLFFFFFFVVLSPSFPSSASPMQGMWVYKTESVISSAEDQKGLFAFCKERQITDLFWQVHFSPAAIMSYRDTAEGRNGIVSLVAKTINYADSTKARIFVGVKMADIGPEKESFFGQTEADMITALKPVEETFRPHSSYAGLAFFHYEAYKVMP